ncbi:MAG TPA: EutN/CcmL family microcompartment protein [Polyangia bacterium]|jgi:ethanolamine utilization protein EutN|nr:EutN/CcmL family microcompartment protein [Polyangia bacterium]
MILGRVVGSVWASRRDQRLGGAKLLVVRPYGEHQPALPTGHVVALDEVDAGVGDDVVVALGRPARLGRGQGGPLADDNLPVDAAIVGVVDRVELDAAASARPGAAPGIRRPLPSVRGGGAA